MPPRGTLVQDGEYATLTFRRLYPHSPEHVWEAIATPDGLRAWLMCTRAVVEGHVGGRIELVSGPAPYHSTGMILAWEPPRVLEYEWNVAPVPEMPRGEHAVFRYELTPLGASTQVVVTYRRITKQTARGFLPGLHAFLDRLEAQLDGHDQPEFMGRFTELRAEYPNGAAMRPLQENDVFHAIAHPVRRAILVTLRDGERAASDLAEPFQMSFPAISQHLRALEEAELVSVRRHGRHRLYRLRPKPLRKVVSWIDEFAAFYGQRLDVLGEYLNRKHGKPRAS